uniref:PDZ domain-containing protein n=1 Tax=Syphacia muris TaxID=451379 RepID=A0A0N5AXF8_9BILA
MATLYPSLEDMIVDQYQSVQRQTNDDLAYWSEAGANTFHSDVAALPKVPSAPLYEPETPQCYSIYPHAPPYFITEAAENPLISSSQTKLPVKQPINDQIIMGSAVMVAPLTSLSTGVQKANITHGVRQVKLAKNKKKDKYGLKFRCINKGVFVQFVAKGSPAAAAGIRFGDQILKVNDVEVLGKDGDKVSEFMMLFYYYLMTKPKEAETVTLTVRDRPFERTMTLHKDSTGTFGFGHKENLIVSINKDSSASRNGLLTDHRILEIDGRSIIGYSTKEVKNCLKEASNTATFTLMPADRYDELVKKLGTSLMRKQDHSIPGDA